MKDETEKQIIESCSGMSFVELENYIERCLNKLTALGVTGKNIPLNKQTYDELLILLESKKGDAQIGISKSESSGQKLKEVIKLTEEKFSKPTRPAQNFERFSNQLTKAFDNLATLYIELNGGQEFEQKWKELNKNAINVRNFS